MGVPDFVKYIARSSPGALCRLPKGDAAQPLLFDFILVDATNAVQTLGLENLLAFLNPNHILAKSAIVFALDSQRDRSGTARSHRHALVRIGDLDVHVQKLCSQLTEVYRAHNTRHRGSAQPTASPHILTSGRGVAGEADYKLLDLQRALLTASLAAGATALPSFLFVSEDSDVLCGALCGPAPQQVSIATKLQDVLYEPSILRLDRVLAFIATCTDAFYAENEREATAALIAKQKAAAERYAAKAKHAAPQAEVVPVVEEEEEEEEVELSVEDRAVAPAAVPPANEDNVVRRRKQDGPMVATGVRIELTDSSEDDEPEEVEKKPVAVSNQQKGAEAAVAKASLSDSPAHAAEKGVAAPVVPDPAPTAGELTVSTITYTSSVDMVFLFMMVMGNAVNVPSLVRGATKVDAGSCWQAYCKQKYKIVSASEAEMGRVLLTTSVNTHSTTKGTYVLNCHFLHAIFDALHYADAEARPPGEEEKHRALAYLSNAVYSTLRYVVGCNLEKPPALQQTFLDSRPLSETTTILPSLSAVMWVLGQEATRTFTFPLYGLPKKDLLNAAAGGASSASLGGSAATPAASLSSSSMHDPTTSAGELDVGDHLVAPVAANAWAVRGARTNTVSLATLVQSFTSGSTAAARTAALGGVPLRSVQLPSMTELLKKCLQQVAPGALSKANLLVYVVTVWEYALGMGVRRLATLTKGAANVARAEGGEQVFTAAQTASSAGNPMRNPAESSAAAAVARAKQSGGHYVYSFELRRMAPVMQSSDTSTQKLATPPAARDTVATAALGGSAASSPSPATGTSSAAGGPSAAQQAIMAALGVSYAYSKQPRAPENVVNLPHSAMDDEDKAELQRLKKVARKERALVATVAAAEKKSAKGGDRSANNNDDDADAASDSDAESAQRKGAGHKKGQKKKKDAAKGKKRLGKRERLQRQKAMEKSGGAPAAAASSGAQKKVAGK